MSKKKVDAGLTTSADLLDFQIKNENLMNELSSNQYKINDIEKELVAMFGNKIDLNQIKNEIQTLPNPALDKIDIQTLPEMQAQHQEILNTKLEISNIHAEYLPTIDLEGKYGNITPTQKLFDNKTEHQIALNLSIPIFTGLTTASKLSQTILNSIRAEHELRQLEINLEKTIDLDKRKINLNGKILSNLEKSLEKASRYKELILFEYKKGIKNSSDVINASDKQFELTRKINELKTENSQLIFTYNTNFKINQDKL
jgi:outer membrane protein TolC